MLKRPDGCFSVDGEHGGKALQASASWVHVTNTFPTSVCSYGAGLGGSDKGDGHSQRFFPQSKQANKTPHTPPKSQNIFPLVSILEFLLNTLSLLIYLLSVEASLYLRPLNPQDVAYVGGLPISPHVLLRMSSGGLVKGGHSCSQAIKRKGNCVLDFILLSLVCVWWCAKILTFFYCISLVLGKVI